jgi:hypothetical protein
VSFPDFVFRNVYLLLLLTMASKASIRKNNLARKIKDQGFIMVSPCVRYARLGKKCVKSEGSDRCSKCVKEGRTHCVESKPSFTDAEWRRLVQAQDSIKKEEEKLLAKLIHLQKQERLLRHRANEFLAHDFKEVEELERLEEQERFEKEQLADRQREDASNAAHLANPQLAAVDDVTFSQLMDNPSFWANIDLSANNIAAQVSGSPSGSQ